MHLEHIGKIGKPLLAHSILQWANYLEQCMCLMYDNLPLDMVCTTDYVLESHFFLKMVRYTINAT